MDRLRDKKVSLEKEIAKMTEEHLKVKRELRDELCAHHLDTLREIFDRAQKKSEACFKRYPQCPLRTLGMPDDLPEDVASEMSKLFPSEAVHDIYLDHTSFWGRSSDLFTEEDLQMIEDFGVIFLH